MKAGFAMQRVLTPARTFVQHPELLVILGCNVLLGLAYSFAVPFFSLFGTIEAGMSPAQFGVFMTVTALAAIVVSTAIARWSDTHWSRRTVLIVGCVGGALGYLGYGYVRSVTGLMLVGCFVVSISSITFSQLFAHAREQLDRSGLPAADAPLYVNVFRLFFALAWTVGPAAASWVLVLFSYRGLFLTTASLFVVLLAIVLRFIPHLPPPQARRTGPRPSLFRTLQRRDLQAFAIGFVLINSASTMAAMSLPLLIIQTLHGTEQQIGIAFSLAPIFEIPLMFYFGLLASRGDQARIIRLGAAIALAYYGLLAAVRAPWNVYPLQLLAAAVTAVNSGVAITFFQNYLPGQHGSATNLYMTVNRIGATAGYLLFGVLASTVGYRGVFVVCSGLALVTALLFNARRSSTGGALAAEPKAA